jgi:putative membrane protein
MKYQTMLPIAAALTLALAAGCDRRANETTGSTRTTSATPSQQDDMLRDAAGSMAEIALGTAASQKATMPDVKSLANRMVADHSKASDELKSLAAKKGVTLPTEMAREPKSEQDKLMKLSGHQFDKEYADFMVKDHEQDLKDFQKAAKDAKDPDVKSWAAKMVPILQEHLNTAKQIDAKVKH